jgi:hypothetical protein
MYIVPPGVSINKQMRDPIKSYIYKKTRVLLENVPLVLVDIIMLLLNWLLIMIFAVLYIYLIPSFFFLYFYQHVG